MCNRYPEMHESAFAFWHWEKNDQRKVKTGIVVRGVQAHSHHFIHLVVINSRSPAVWWSHYKELTDRLV